MTCIVCDAPVQRPYRSFCSAECQRIRHNERSAAARRAKEEREGKSWNAIYAETKKQASAARHARMHEAGTTPRQLGQLTKYDDVRRARKLGTQTETIDKNVVYERDEWLCGICGSEIDSALTYPNPMSASLDHIQPLSKEGTHTLDNVQAAHLSCNVIKGNRTE